MTVIALKPKNKITKNPSNQYNDQIALEPTKWPKYLKFIWMATFGVGLFWTYCTAGTSIPFTISAKFILAIAT